MIWWWLACSAADPQVAPAPEVEPAVELLPGPNRALVIGHCTGCHSASLIRQNRMTRERWDATITWMQETQGLWPLSEEHRARVLDYLEEVQGPLEAVTDSPWAQPLYAPNPAW